MFAIALNLNAQIIGYFAGDDTDVINSSDSAIKYENSSDAEAELCEINSSWLLNEGESFSVVAI